MEKVILVKYGEIMLKGLNRPVFERQLEKNIKHVIGGRFDFEVSKEHGRIFVKVDGSAAESREAALMISRVFGIVSVHFAIKAKLEAEQILEAAVETASLEYASGKRTFKVETRRPNKLFPKSSMELSAMTGG
ncbi:MAG: THUMP domain-containing protein, partial [Clostridia bacterium]